MICSTVIGLLLLSPVSLGAPSKAVVRVPGDVMLGALMMVHERENETLICGEVMPQGGIQALEAMLFTLDYVNRVQLIPNVTLGALILDDCDKDTYGLQQTVEFIKGNVQSIDSNYVCHHINTTKNEKPKPFTGVVAAASSVTSIQVANLLKLFQIPQISFFSTSPELSLLERFPYFFRTIPSDEFQTKAMFELIKRFKWSYVSVIYEESSYGTQAFNELERYLAKEQICIAVKEHLPKDSDVARQAEYVRIVKRLQTKPNAKGVIIYGSDQEVHGFMQAVKSQNATGQFTWIGSDGWSARDMVYRGGYVPEVLGTISVQPTASKIAGFEDYFNGLTVENNERNPWFYEFWEHEFKCTYPRKPRNPFNTKYTETCNTTAPPNYSYDFEKQLQFVSDAVLAFAYGIKSALEEICSPWDYEWCVQCYTGRLETSGCAETRIDGDTLKRKLESVQFVGLAGNNFSFLPNSHDPRPNYKIIHFRKKPGSDEAVWVQVGNFTFDGLFLNESALQFYTSGTKGKQPSSFCSKACLPEETKRLFDGDSCCWACNPCSDTQFKANESSCVDCGEGYLPLANKSGCYFIAPESAEFVSVYGIICSILALVGFVINLFILISFLRHNDTPLVKASGRELCYVILAGLFLCFLVTPVALVPPHPASCGILRILSGFCFVLIYSGILTKTNRIARIFRSGKKTTKRPYMISPKSQMLICSTLCSIQLVLVALWLYAYPPETEYIHPARDQTLLVCRETVVVRYFLTYAYPITLCILCTYYAFQTRKMPQAFNESKLIGCAVYLTCVIWLAFLPVYTLSFHNTPLRVTSVCVATTLNGFVIQACMFLPKCYIILFRPEKNVRGAVLGARNSTCGTGRALFSTANTNIGLATGGTAPVRVDPHSENSLFSEDEVVLDFPRRGRDRSSSIGTQTPSPSVEEPLLSHSLANTTTSLLTPSYPNNTTTAEPGIVADVAL